MNEAKVVIDMIFILTDTRTGQIQEMLLGYNLTDLGLFAATKLGLIVSDFNFLNFFSIFENPE